MMTTRILTICYKFSPKKSRLITTWERPLDEVALEAVPESVENAIAEETQPTELTALEEQPEQLSRLTSLAILCRLGPGWVEIIDEASGSPYYLNESDGTTTWERPSDEETLEGAEEGTNTAADGQATKMESPPGEKLKQRISQKMETPAETVLLDDHSALPPGWVEIVDETAGPPYYFHEADGIATWEQQRYAR